MKKVILITGGSDGLGKATAKALNAEHSVIIIGKNKEKTEKVAQEIGCDFFVCDVSNFEQVDATAKSVIEKYSKIDCLINNAGIWIQGMLEENTYEDISQVIDVNTKGVIYITKAFVPFIKEQGSGRIINVISQAGLHVKAERTVYHASKWAITGFTNSLRMELSKSGICVSGYYPGAMQTDFFEKQGIYNDMNKHLPIEEAVRALTFIIESDPSVQIPELGIKPLE